MTEEALARQMKAAFRAAAENVGQRPKAQASFLGRLRREVARRLKALHERVVDTLDLASVKVAATKAHVFQRISTTRIGRGWETVTRTAGRTQLALRHTAERARSEALALRKATCQRLRSGQFQATAAGAVTGAAAVGASGGATGLAGGAAIGTAVGSLGAIFTFGLSVPIGAAIGAGSGWLVGTAVGVGVGAVGGGTAASKIYQRRESSKRSE
eukprot:symbB.v1.2.012861.t1/scaffold875.1/size155714/10